MQELLDRERTALAPLAKEGKTASYIPALQKANPRAFGACVIETDGTCAKSGDYRERFTIQSISKVLSFICCLLDTPAKQVFEKISVESSPAAFNAIADLETHETKKPLNPMINAGAIACMDFVAGDTAEEKFERVQALTRTLAKNPAIGHNEEVFRSERQSGDRNRSLAYYMKSTGIITGEVDTLLDAYFRVCALEMTCEDLAQIGAVLAGDGKSASGEEFVPAPIVKTARTVMALCGMYNESGRYAIQVGVPSKSGVGGGILAVVPNKMGIGIFAPALNEYGSSVCGIALMGALSRQLGLSVF